MNGNQKIPSTFLKIKIFLKEKVQEELSNIKFQGRPLLIIILTLFILMVPTYRRYAWDGPESEGTLFLRIIFPVFVILFLFREELTDYGLGLGFKKKGLILFSVFLVCYIPFLGILYTNDSFYQYYQATNRHLVQWKLIALNEINGLFNILKDEFFFRGFLLFGLRKYFGDSNAILLQGIPYSLLHIGKPELECYGSIMVGIALGYLAIKSNSIWYGLALHWIIATTLHLMIIYPSIG